MAGKKAAPKIKLQRHDKPETAEKKPVAKSEAKVGGVHLDPANTPLIPGNTVTFVATPGDPHARQGVKIETDKSTWLGTPSVSSGQARQSLGLETGHGEITVTFYEDGKAYASGKYEV